MEGADENSDFVLYNTCTVRENANLKSVWPSWISERREEKKSGYDDRTLRLHDAGARGCRKDQKELPPC